MPRALVSVLLLAGLTGCFNPDDILAVQGRVDSPEALAGHRIEFLREPKASVGGGCDSAEPFDEARTDEEGRFGFEVFRAQTQRATGVGNYCFRLRTRFPGSAVQVKVDLPRISGEVTLPPLTDWRPGLTTLDGGFQFATLGPPPPASPKPGELLVVHRLEAFTTSGTLAWRADDVLLDPETLTPRWVGLRDDLYGLGEFRTYLSLRARLVTVAGLTSQFQLGSDTPTVEVVSGEYPQHAASVRPAGRVCADQLECQLTNGSLQPVDTMGEQVFEFDVSPRVPTALVLRGVETMSGFVDIALFDIAGNEHPSSTAVLPFSLYDLDGPWRTVSLPDGGVAAQVLPQARFFTLPLGRDFPISRVKLTFPLGVQRMSEVSVY